MIFELHEIDSSLECQLYEALVFDLQTSYLAALKGCGLMLKINLEVDPDAPLINHRRVDLHYARDGSTDVEIRELQRLDEVWKLNSSGK